MSLLILVQFQLNLIFVFQGAGAGVVSKIPVVGPTQKSPYFTGQLLSPN